MKENNSFQQEPDENIYQAWERFKVLLMKCPQHYLTKMQKVILFYNGLGIPTRQILDSRGATPSKTAADAKVAIQEMAEYSQKLHNGTSRSRSTKTSDGLAAIQAQLNNLGRDIKKVNVKVYAAQVGSAPGFYQRNNANPSYQELRQSMKDTLSKFMSESAKRHEENSNLIKEIRALTDAAIQNQRASIKTLKIRIRQMSKNRTLMYETRQTTVSFPIRLNGYYCEEKKRSYRPQFSEAYSEALHINTSIPRKEKYPRSFTLPCFINNVYFDNAIVNLGDGVNVMPLSTYLNLGLGELAHTKLTVELADRTMKYPKGIAENMLVGIGKFVFPIDFIILDMPEDIKVPLILERPFLSIARAKIDVFERNITLRVREEKIIFKSIKPARSLIKRVYMLSLRERMELDLEVRLMEKILKRSSYDLMPTIKEGKVIEEFRNRDDELDTGINDYPSYCDHVKKIHIDCAYNLKFSCMIVLDDMDAYRDKRMGDVIFGEPFLKEIRINARRFEGMITIYNGNDEVTYQMVRTHLRFKHHTNKQCNKIPPLLKDPNIYEMRRWKNGSHAGTLACMRWNGLRMKSRLSLKNDMPPRDNKMIGQLKVYKIQRLEMMRFGGGYDWKTEIRVGGASLDLESSPHGYK
uniref:Reverse transcriptase domain-containing protein n=1 Tax=Tanacetum cinerariifolium TaxID=118510 RepID=A0A6L2NPK1_TANCI|nr:hypothetical protein [Tanacetum cinerariifolium]